MGDSYKISHTDKSQEMKTPDAVPGYTKNSVVMLMFVVMLACAIVLAVGTGIVVFFLAGGNKEIEVVFPDNYFPTPSGHKGKEATTTTTMKPQTGTTEANGEVGQGRHCCGSTFQYTIENDLMGDIFNETTVLLVKAEKSLIRHMTDAVMQNPNRFKSFTVKFSSPYGFYVTSVNGVASDWANYNTWWELLGNNSPLPVGISTYVPKPFDRITLRFTNESSHL